MMHCPIVQWIRRCIWLGWYKLSRRDPSRRWTLRQGPKDTNQLPDERRVSWPRGQTPTKHIASSVSGCGFSLRSYETSDCGSPPPEAFNNNTLRTILRRNNMTRRDILQQTHTRLEDSRGMGALCTTVAQGGVVNAVLSEAGRGERIHLLTIFPAAGSSCESVAQRRRGSTSISSSASSSGAHRETVEGHSGQRAWRHR